MKIINLVIILFSRSISPVSRGNLASIYANPIEALPHTNFGEIHNNNHVEQHVNFPPPVPPRTCFSPQPSRDAYQSNEDENVAIQNQVSLRKSISKFLQSSDPCMM
jgi:hypothetical protein